MEEPHSYLSSEALKAHKSKLLYALRKNAGASAFLLLRYEESSCFGPCVADSYESEEANIQNVRVACAVIDDDSVAVLVVGLVVVVLVVVGMVDGCVIVSLDLKFVIL
ncbi:hypothetical protein DPMN_169494 [Dreissena polymorpha]|uniref:Uncharacterized protein n=1 Tax=Dreissena polymorpha TaxID=45954 RepID=A0A9D4DUI3_DREPO|nr:hypothetical protein DPMN_169494 [Dreissena polymorpha]